MIALLHAAWFVASCLLDVGSHCAELVETDHGIHCAVVAPHDTCPIAIDPPGFHAALNLVTCSHACGPDDQL